LHCPLTPETTHLINNRTVNLMKGGLTLINTARGALIDTRALIDALKTRDHLWYLGIDVYEGKAHCSSPVCHRRSYRTTCSSV
jgi:D-lactate dehydrogenase